MVDQGPLPAHVALVHAAHLRDGHVRLVDDQQEVLGEVVEQCVRRRARRATVDVPRVVLDAAAEPDLPHHLDVVGRAHAQPLRLEQLPLLLQLGEPVLELGLDAGDRPLHALRARHVVRRREHQEVLRLPHHLTRQRVQVGELLDLVAEHLDADGELLVDREDLDRVAAHPERAAGERQVVARVLHVHQPPQQRVAVDLVADPEPDTPVDVLLRRPQAVDAGDGGDDHDVPPGQQAHRRRVPQPLDLLVQRGVLLDVGVRLRDVRLGLVVVVVRDEVLDRVVRQQLTELVRQLGRQRLVRREDERRALHLLDEPRRRRALAGTGGAEQDDVRLTGVDAPRQLRDRRRLIAARLEVALDLEGGLSTLDVTDGSHVGNNTTDLRQFPAREDETSPGPLLSCRSPTRCRARAGWEPTPSAPATCASRSRRGAA